MKPGQSLKLLLGDLTPSIHIPDMLPMLPSDRPPAVVQSPILFKRDGCASLGIWHVLTFSRITIGLLRHRSDHPVIVGDLADAHDPPG